MSSYADEMAYIQRECAEAEEADFLREAVARECCLCGDDCLALPWDTLPECARCAAGE